VPLLPLFSGVLEVDQFKVDALNGAVGPTPPLIGLNGEPVPRGIAKQFWQEVPRLGDVPWPLVTVAGANGAPVLIVPGMDAERGFRLSSPHGEKSEVYFECALPGTGPSSYQS
jgi:hypothetical protein